MPATIDGLINLLDLEHIELGLFRGQNPETTLQRAYGGQVLAQALMAASRTIELPEAGDRRMAHSLHAYFIRPGRTDVPIMYDVEQTRDGGSFSTRRVVARQGGKNIFAMSASFQDHEDGFEHQDPEPGVPAPEDCPPMSEVLSNRSGRPPEIWAAEWGSLDVRYVDDTSAGAPGDEHPARQRVWVRANGELPDLLDDPVLHQAVLAYASDLTLLSVSTVPHGVAFHTEVQAASLDHAMWFHRPVRADQWWLYDQHSPSASNGRGLSMGRIFAGGELAASCAQEGLIRPLQPKAKS